MARPWLLLLMSALLSSYLFDTLVCAAGSSSPSAASSSSSRDQGRRLLQSTGTAPSRNIETFFPSNAAPAFINPPPPPLPLPSAPPFATPAPAPPSQDSSSTVTVAKAVVATAASTFVVSGLLFFALHRFAFKQRKVESYERPENKFREDGGRGAVANPYRPGPVNGMLKAVVVDEDGLDVLYWRTLDDGARKRCVHCMQEIRGDGGDGSAGAGTSIRGGGRREESGGRRARKPREVERRVQQTPLLPADSLSSSDRIRPVLSTESERSSMSGGAASMMVAAEAAASETSAVAPSSPPLPMPPGRRGPTSKSPSPASSTTSLPQPAAALHLPSSPKSLSAAAPPPPPQARPAPPTPQARQPSSPPPPPPPPAPLAAKRNPAPPPPRPPPVANKNLGPSRPPTVPRSSSRSSAAEGVSEENTKAPTKMKPLHWDKMTTAHAQHSMVWDKISDGSFRFDDDLMEALFGYVATNRKSPKNGSSSANPFNSVAAGGGGPPAQVCLLDPRKSQNTAIVLKSLAVTRQEILDALLEGRGLSSDTLEKLSKLAPTKEEEATILGFSGNPSSLADAESFLFHLLRAIPSTFARADAMLFKANYDPEVLHLRESLHALEAACGELRKQGLFWKMLEAVLKAGNRMNAGTARGNAQAFNLASLRKLSDVKSTDGKTTLLHFVVESVVRSEGKHCVVNRNHSFGRTASRSAASSSSPAPGAPRREKEMEYMTLGLPVVGGLSIEFANVKKAAAVDYDAMLSVCSTLGARVAEVRRLLVTCGDGGGGFVKEMSGFVRRAEEELKALREEQARVVELVKKTTEYYMVGATQDRAAPPLQLFHIVKDFLGMVDQACVDIARNLQQQKRKPPSRTGSPPAHQKRAPTRFPNLPAHFMSEKSKSSSSSGGGGDSSSDSEDDGF